MTQYLLGFGRWSEAGTTLAAAREREAERYRLQHDMADAAAVDAERGQGGFIDALIGGEAARAIRTAAVQSIGERVARPQIVEVVELGRLTLDGFILEYEIAEAVEYGLFIVYLDAAPDMRTVPDIGVSAGVEAEMGKVAGEVGRLLFVEAFALVGMMADEDDIGLAAGLPGSKRISPT